MQNSNIDLFSTLSKATNTTVIGSVYSDAKHVASALDVARKKLAGNYTTAAANLENNIVGDKYSYVVKNALKEDSYTIKFKYGIHNLDVNGTNCIFDRTKADTIALCKALAEQVTDGALDTQLQATFKTDASNDADTDVDDDANAEAIAA